jgi:hypothetical protein
MKTVINFISFQVGWFACVLGAANDMPWIGPAVCFPILSLHLFMSGRPAAELRLILAAPVIGLVLDSLLVATGWLVYPNGMLIQGIAPYWILLMWALFATTLNVSMRWLHGKYVLAALLGAIGGPLSYLAGARLGGLVFSETTLALIALALGWAIAMPVLLYLAQRFSGHLPRPVPGVLETADA